MVHKRRGWPRDRTGTALLDLRARALLGLGAREGWSGTRPLHPEGRSSFQDLALHLQFCHPTAKRPVLGRFGGLGRKAFRVAATCDQPRPASASGRGSMLRFRAHARFAAIDRPDDRTSATVSALNSGECCRRCCPIGTPFARPSLACRVSTFWGERSPLVHFTLSRGYSQTHASSRVIEARGRLEASLHSASSACPPYPTLARPHSRMGTNSQEQSP